MAEARTILITGATDGLGLALAERLAAEGDRVILHGRDADKLAAAASRVATAAGAQPTVLLADLAELAQVRALAEQVAEVTERLDVLVSNAGIGSGEPEGRERMESADGHELRFAVNYLAGFDLTLRLLPLLAASPSARIVNVASIGQYPLDFDDVMLEHGYSGTRAYAQSKLAQITSGFVLAERLDGPERTNGRGIITVNSLHPATYMPTKIVLSEIGRSVDSLELGVEATGRLASSPQLEGVSGRFFDRLQEARAEDSAYDPEVQRRLWRLSLELTGAPDPS
jgi:NAD(P)-dependent dehydrogenase (short-subunit alcohol dehydrogenase family)